MLDKAHQRVKWRPAACIFVLSILIQAQALARWEQIGTVPSSIRMNFTVSAVDGKLYLIGGTDRFGVVSLVERYDPTFGEWTRKTNMPTPRLAHAMCVLNDNIYILGGQGRQGEQLATVERYNPAIDQWETKAPMPTGRWGLKAEVAQGRIYAIGGYTIRGQWESIVEEYDPQADVWTTKTRLPLILSSFAAGSINGRIYIFGGWDGVKTSRTTLAYDPQRDQWIARSGMLTARCLLASTSIAGLIYTFGGWTDGGRTRLSTAEVYDPQQNRWSKSDDLLSPSDWLTATNTSGIIYLFGFRKEEMETFLERFNTGLNVPSAYELPTVWGRLKRDGGSTQTR